MAAAVTERTRLVFVCNPNNPTGTAGGRAELDAFLTAYRPTSSWCSTRPTASTSPTRTCRTASTCSPTSPTSAVLRTFSKAYGLAGLRVG